MYTCLSKPDTRPQQFHEAAWEIVVIGDLLQIWHVQPIDTSCPCADAARLHEVLQQLEPISQRQGLSAAAGMGDLISQHKALQQQIAETQQRAAKLRLVADVEKRQAQFEACLSAGITTSCFEPMLQLLNVKLLLIVASSC